MGRPTKRILLKRRDVPVLLWVTLLTAGVFTVYCIFGVITAWRGLSVITIFGFSALAVLSTGVVVSVWRLLGRKIVFLDKYISYTGWFGTPRTYRYEDIIDIKTVTYAPEAFSFQLDFEDNVTIIFADGQKLRVPTTAMRPREVRRRIESKTGLKFESSLKLGKN